jgi:hypothetical protein
MILRLDPADGNQSSPCHEHNLKQNLIHYIYHKNKKNKACEIQGKPI